MTLMTVRSLPSILLLLISALGLTCCSTPQRNIASENRPYDAVSFEQGLLKSSGMVLSTLKGLRASNDACARYLRDFQKALSKIGPKDISQVEIEDDSLAVVDQLWEMRLTLHSKLSEMQERSCVEEIQNSFRLIRYLEDYLAQRKFRIPSESPKARINFGNQLVPILKQSPDYFLLRTVEMKRLHDFRRGDLLIARTPDFLPPSSSGTADQGVFNRMFLVSVDEQTRKISAQELSAEGRPRPTGSVELKTALKGGHSRILHLRAKDRSLAINADRAMQRMEPPYGAVTGPSHFEIDPRFEILEEWRDLRLTQESRMKDAIRTQMRQWMSQLNYELKSDQKLTRVAALILKELRAKDNKFEEKKGWAMSYQILSETLDSLRKSDLEIYKNPKTRKKARFHQAFRPKDIGARADQD